MKTSPIVQKASEYVFNLLREKLPGNHLYHNYTHSANVAEAAMEIAEGSNVSKEDTEIILLAAWFHDTGFVEAYDGHENVSKHIAEQFLKENLYPEEKIETIKNCIEATHYPQQPHNMLEYVLCDADLSGIASKKYFEKARFLRQEIELVKGKKYNDIDWYKSEIDFLTQHKYHTPYAHINFDKRKTEHILELNAELNKLKTEESKNLKKQQVKDEELKLKEEKQKRPERGTETVFRVAVSNHMNLSKMADDKANFLLSINGIILSFAIANLITKFDTNRFIILPTGILTLVCLGSIIFAILSTRPKVNIGKFTKQDVAEKKVNLLFFGNFFKMKFDDFSWGFEEMLQDREYLYGSLIKDLYFLGLAVGSKFKLVRIAYTIFMYGIIISVLSYIASYFYYAQYLAQVPTAVSRP